MTIETKFNIGDEVWFYLKERYKRKPTANVGFITGINVSIMAHFNKRVDISYTIPCDKDRHYLNEHELFPTKESLLQSL
jgi:hypothetical protein